MIKFTTTKTVAVGEAMIEMADIGDGNYRKSFAGDTFNTAWHMSQIPDVGLPVGYVTMVGTDTISDEFVNALQSDGLETSFIGRASDRTMGLYVIELDGVERKFHYWREASAARLLADDEDWLSQSFSDAGLIHVSGITLGILRPDARMRLISALANARSKGARVSFDPNFRPKLWASPDEAREAVSQMLKVTDIALPSFDDEHALWGDASPQETIRRFSAASVSEIVIKNGAAPVTYCTDGVIAEKACPSVAGIKDTSGAGDAFNAGYLAARLLGADPTRAIDNGQKMSAKVLQHFGARIPQGQVPALAETLS